MRSAFILGRHAAVIGHTSAPKRPIEDVLPQTKDTVEHVDQLLSVANSIKRSHPLAWLFSSSVSTIREIMLEDAFLPRVEVLGDHLVNDPDVQKKLSKRGRSNCFYPNVQIASDENLKELRIMLETVMPTDDEIDWETLRVSITHNISAARKGSGTRLVWPTGAQR